MHIHRTAATGLAALSLLFAGCGGSAPIQQTKPATAKLKPVQACMAHVKLTDIQFRGGDGAANGYRNWRGTTSDGDLVRITQLENKRAAKSAVKAASDVQGVAGGRYAVFSVFGTGLIIKPLANCLRKVG